MNASPLLAAPFGGRLFAERDPRALLLAVLLFALVTVSLTSLLASALAMLLGLLSVVLAGLSWRELLKRLLLLEGLMLVLLLTLPFSVPGELLLSLGPLSVTQAGLNRALLIALKAHAVALALLGLLGPLEPVVIGHALARLGCPAKLAHLLLMSLRQIAVLQQEFARLRQAMRARGFVARGNRHTWTSYGQLMGMLLVRSLDRARRIEAAMRCRGFHGRLYLLDSLRWQRADTALLLILVIISGGLLALDQ
jgi:cobalt/nickel transport system permease protein